MFLVLFSIYPFPAPLRGIRVRVSRQAHLERQMLCLHIPRGCPFPMGEAPPGTNLAATAAVRYPRATAPRPSPPGPFGPVIPILFSSNGCTGRIALRSWVITSFPSSMVPFPPQRCETNSLRPHLLSSKKCGPTWLTFRIRSLYVTSSQVATKLIYDCLELPASLAGSCSESLMLVIRQKYGTSCPTFLLAAIIRAKVGHKSSPETVTIMVTSNFWS